MSPGAAQPIGRYAVFGELASGGMASVHFARLFGPSGFARTVVVKRPHSELAKQREFVMMFIDEARLAARIRHPNVVSTLDVIETPGELALVMEYVHGESLSRLCAAARARGERPPLPIAVAIVIDALHGLHAAHEATDEQGKPLGLVHRDISPQNMLVGADGITRIADFGIAKAAGRLLTTKDGAIKGKYAYMAPEQIRGGAIDRSTDVYAASIVLWELLTGQALFRSDNEAETIYKCLEAAVPPPSAVAPDVPAVFDDILRRGLARDPAERYPTARALAADLERAAPAVRASEVGAWVERLAGDTLAARADSIAAMERSGPVGYAELEPTVPSGGAALAPTAISQISHAGVVAERAAGASRARSVSRRTWATVIVTAALSGVLGTLLFASGRIAPRAPAASRSASPAPAVPSSSSASVVGIAAPDASVAEEPPAEGSDAAAPHTSVVTEPAGSAPSTRAAATSGPRAKPRPRCDPPYTIDSVGRKIFKLECL